MVVWLLKLLIVSLNIRSTSKSLSRKSRRTRDGSSSSSSSPRTVPRKKRLKGEVTNWIVWVSYLVIEQLCDRVINWVPFYGTFKAFVLLLLLLARGTGSQMLYARLIKPTIKPWEKTLDLVGFVLGEVLEITIYCLLLVPRWAVTKWRRERAQPDVPSILRGLRRQNPVPRVAESLARSLERQQGDADKINERLSKPVTIRLNPIQASQPVRRKPTLPTPPPPRLPTASASTLSQSPVEPVPFIHPGPVPSLPPPSFSTAPFRPVKPTMTTSRASIQANNPSQASATTVAHSRLPISSSRATTSIYPSLPSLPSALANSGTADPTQPELPAHRPIPSTSQQTSPNSGRSSYTNEIESETPGKQESARISRESFYNGQSTGSSNASPLRTTTTKPTMAVPMTPAPPGAFKLASSNPRSSPPRPRPELAESEPMDLEIEEASVESESLEATPPRRRSSRRSHETEQEAKETRAPLEKLDDRRRQKPKRTIEANDLSIEVDTPKKKKLKSSPVVVGRDRSESTRASRAREPLEEVNDGRSSREDGELAKNQGAATPRQRALGAISRLTNDLLDEEEGGGPFAGLSSAKKAKGKLGSVLARSSSVTGGNVRKVAVSTRSNRGANGETEEAYNAEEEEMTLPRKRKATRVAKRERDVIDEKTDHVVETAKKPVGKVTPAASKAIPRAAAAKKPVRLPPLSASSATSRRSAPASTSLISSRAPSPSTQVESAKDSRPRAMPTRKARRVLRRADGAAELEDEVEIEGVAVVASRRKR